MLADRTLRVRHLVVPDPAMNDRMAGSAQELTAEFARGPRIRSRLTISGRAKKICQRPLGIGIGPIFCSQVMLGS
jgi:hypothetical protein